MEKDRTSGAAELERRAISYLEGCESREELFERCFSILSTYPSMASMWNIANFAFGRYTENEFKNMERANEKVVENGTDLIENGSTILTYSRSSTVSKILQGCKNKEISVICSESRPKYEGRKLATELSEKGIDVTFTTDASLASFVDKADIVMIGADAILEKGIVNKTGTSCLASYANERKKDVYVVSSSYKAFPFVFLKDESGNEVWEDAPDGIDVRNFYFDFTDIKNISYFVTEKGVSEKKPVFARKLSDEILEIKKMLESKYLLLE